MIPHDLAEHLTRSLAHPLPGRRAQRSYAHPIGYGRHFGPAPRNARRAAVMVLIYWDGEQWILPLTRRVAKGIHSSQICFAGGGMDPGESAVDTAIRECREETGWAPTKADVVGQLSPIFVYASNNWVKCIVAVSNERPTWNRDPREVAEIIDIPLRDLCADTKIHRATLHRFGLPNTAPCFRWKTYDIWGATSMIISELKAVILS